MSDERTTYKGFAYAIGENFHIRVWHRDSLDSDPFFYQPYNTVDGNPPFASREEAEAWAIGLIDEQPPPPDEE